MYAFAAEAQKLGSTVVAFNRPLCPITTAIKKPHRIKELLRKSTLEKLDSNLYLFSGKYFIHDHIAARTDFLEKLNLKALRNSYKFICKNLNVNEPHPIVWFYYPQQGYVTNLFKESFSIFEIYDDLTDIYGRENDFIMKLEWKLHDRVDLLLAVNNAIFNRYSERYKNSYLFGNGLSRSVYENLVRDDTVINSSIVGIKRPRIGYAGMVSERLDWTLIRHLAELKPDWSFIFAGHVSDSKIIGNLKNYSNVYFTGRYMNREVPSILKGFDVGILPYLDTEFFYNFKPLKFFEYASAGLPSVSTFSYELESYSQQLIRLVHHDPDDWLYSIQQQLDADKKAIKKIGREVGGKCIWDDMCAKLMKVIAHALKP